MSRFDRKGAIRKQPEGIAARLCAADTLLLPLWRNKSWIARGEPMRPGYLDRAACADLLRDLEPVFLGERAGRAVFAVDLPALDDTPKRQELALGDFNDLRFCGGRLDAQDFEELGYARALLHWHRHHRHCGSCGSVTRSEEGGHVRACTSCGEKVFPRTDPAIMSLVTRGDRLLLARQPSWPKGMFSVLAGFVEPGETLEQAVARETAEEVGVSVSEIHYLRSQPWPFPCSLMIGFRAEAESDRFRVDGEEIEEARWLTREELRNPEGFFIPPPFSLAHQLIGWFLAGTAHAVADPPSLR